jgi:hypothetical protein
MQRIMTEPVRDTDGVVLGVSFSTDQARLDARTDGTFYLEAFPLLEADDLRALHEMIGAVLRSYTSTGGTSVRQG